MVTLLKEYSQWETLIIQWINCLELTNPISNLEEIRSGEFFTTLLNDLQNLSEKNEDILSKIYHFLKLKYPFPIYCSKNAETIQTVPPEELLIACTLLMHYSCIYDRRNKYTMPLCRKLSEESQFLIKAFLGEELTSYEEIIEHIKVILKKDAEPKTPRSKCSQFLSSDGDNSLKNSPLKDFLETTPTRLTLIAEKDKKIKNLIQELQTERFEKEDMIMELKEKDEKIKKLNKQITEKSQKIIRLRDEIANTDFQKTPHKLKQFEENERRLKVELIESKNYVEQLHQEQEAASYNLDLLSKKLKSTEEEACVWQTKSLEFAAKHEDLMKNYKFQEIELNNLKVNYCEVRTMLEELRSSNNANESALDNIDKPCQETLASSVIEIQMLELQEENSVLKNTVKDLNNNCDSLQRETQQLKAEMMELKESKSELESKNNNILIEADVLKNENSLQKNQLDLCNKSLSDTKESLKIQEATISQQKTALELYEKSLSETKDNLKERDEVISNLKSAIELTTNECKAKLSNKDMQIAKLDEEKNNFEKCFNDLKIEFEETCSNLATFRSKFESLDEQFRLNLLKLEKLLTNQNKIKLENRNELFAILISVLKDKLAVQESEQSNLQKTNDDYQNLVLSMQKELDNLQHKLEISSRDLKNVNCKLEDANSVNQKLEDAIKLQNETILEKNKMIESHESTIKGLEEILANLKEENCKLSSEITTKTDEIVKNQDLCDNIKMELTEVINERKSQQELINRLQDTNVTLSNAFDEYKQKMEQLQGVALQTQAQNTEQISKLNEQISNYENQVEKLESDLTIAESKFEETILKLQDLSNTKKAELEKFKMEINSFNHKLKLLETSIKTLTKELEDAGAEKEVLKVELQEQMEAYKEVKYEENKCRLECVELHKQLLGLRENLDMEKAKCVEINEVNSRSTRELVTAKINLEHNSREAQKSKIIVEGLREGIKEAKAEIETMHKAYKEKNEQMSCLKEEIKIFEASKEETKEKYNELHKNLQNVLNEWDIDSAEIITGLQQLSNMKESTQKKIIHYKNLLNETTVQLKQANDNLSSNEAKYEKDITQLNKEIAKLKNEIDSLRTQEISCIREIHELKEELNYAVNQYSDAVQKEKELKMENEAEKKNLQENIHDLLQKYNYLNVEHQKTSEQLEKLKTFSGEMTTAKEKLEVVIAQQKKKFEDDFCSTAEQYCSELKDLKSKEANSLNTIDKLKAELEKERSNRKLLNEELNKATDELNEATNEHSSLLSKIEVAVQINQRFEEMYETLKVEHENYLRESASTLLETKNELSQSIDRLQSKCASYETDIQELKKERTYLSDELKKSKELFEIEISSKDLELLKHVEAISELQTRLNLVNEEQRIIKEQVSKDLLAYNELSKICCEKNMKASELENKVAQLQCGNIVLETEKNQLEKMYEDKSKDYKKLEEQINEEKAQFKEEIKTLKAEISSLEKSVVSKELKIESSQNEIQQLQEKLVTVNKVIVCLNEDTANKNKSFETQLSVIEEDHNKKLEQSLSDFNILKDKYNELNEQHSKLQHGHEIIKEDFSMLTKVKESLEEKLQQKEIEIVDLTTRENTLKSLIEKYDSKIISLQEELEAKLEQVENLYWQKRCDEIKLQELSQKLIQVTTERDDLLEKRVKLIEDTENSLVRAHENAINVKKDLISKLETHEKDLKERAEIKTDLENLLSQEKKSREFFENQVLELTNEKHNSQILNKQLKSYIEKLVNLTREIPLNSEDMSEIEDAIQSTELKIMEIINKTKELNETIADLEKERQEIPDKLQRLENCNVQLMKEKEKLSMDYEVLCKEKINLCQDKDKESKSLQNLKVQYDLLKEKFDEIEDNKLDVKLVEIKQKDEKKYEEYHKFLAESTLVKKQLEEIVTKRNALEKIIVELKNKHINLQINSTFITEEQHNLQFQQKLTLDVVIEDIQKQFNRQSKLANNSILRTCQIFEKTVTGILNEKPIEWRRQLEDLSVQDISDKLDELKDNSEHTLEQLQAFENSLTKLNIKSDEKKKILKENVPQTQSLSKPDEDWMKKYKDIKQRLILVENSRNNFEKKLKQLREENKNLSQLVNTNENDAQYKSLLQEYITSKDNFELVSQKLSQTESVCKDLKTELHNIRTAYSNIKSDYAKLEEENYKLKRSLNTRSEELCQLQNIKEAYEKLFEEHNKLRAEVDTLKYKRIRDQEEYQRLLKQNNISEIDEKVKSVRNEYEFKMEKMKTRMMQLYKTEMEREMEKSATLKSEKENLLKTIDSLKEEIKRLTSKLRQINPKPSGNVATRFDLNFPARRETISSVDLFKEHRPNERDIFNRVEDRRYSTLPRNVDFQEEARKNPTGTSAAVARLEMEDEDELFNNKYLREMKEGITNLPQNDRESTSSRLSVLAYRNSLCPPHLKSSYPAETQFLNPNRFKDEDIKVGNVDLNDSMSARLLPHEKSKKKDIGTTSYKRPGPPTPSKNGGRASLQGNEQNTLREHNDNGTKKLTPSRLKSLFSRNKSGSEANPVSPKGKRLSIFNTLTAIRRAGRRTHF